MQFQASFIVFFEVPQCEYYEFSKICIFCRKYVCFWMAGREIQIFTTKNAYSTFFAEKVRRTLPACPSAGRPRILEAEKVYRTCVKFNILIFSRSQMRRHFGFQTGSVVCFWLRNFTETECPWSVRKRQEMRH